MKDLQYDIIIVGGSYAGLSAAMSLGRALRKVLVIDGGKPCNRQTPYSHNFITHDGDTPAQIAADAKQQVMKYDTITFLNAFAIDALQLEDGFEITTQEGRAFTGSKLIFATGLKDFMPDIPGFAECWGISILHCPYCHGYEVRHQPTGILGNGESGFELVKMISNWSKDLTLFTNGPSTLTPEQQSVLEGIGVVVAESPVSQLEHAGGQLQKVVLADGSKHALTAVYAHPRFEQHSNLPEKLGCKLTERGLIEIDFMQKTSVPGIYACGDNSNMARSLAVAVASGMMAGAMANREHIMQQF